MHETLAALRADGVEHLALISGDALAPATALAAELGLDDCFAELLPEDKARTVATLREARGTIHILQTAGILTNSARLLTHRPPGGADDRTGSATGALNP